MSASSNVVRIDDLSQTEHIEWECSHRIFVLIAVTPLPEMKNHQISPMVQLVQ